MVLLRYFGSLPRRKVALWCYLIWYLISVAYLFDPSPWLWLNSAGISLVIGIALQFSVSAASPKDKRWQTIRLFLMPFCVSSFGALIKGNGYILIFPTKPAILLISIAACLVFVALTLSVRTFATTLTTQPPSPNHAIQLTASARHRGCNTTADPATDGVPRASGS
jgi:hypothetical protein